MFEWLKTILILPFNVVVIIPSLILYLSNYSYKMPNKVFLIIGIILFILGLFLAIWTMVLFNNIGKGTPAPWNPPKNLVIEGPYCYVRNPMIIGILLILTSEYFLLNSIQILWWVILFFIINNIHFRIFEEKQLEKNFGEDYIKYKKNVPMWLPRLTPWRPTPYTRK